MDQLKPVGTAELEDATQFDDGKRDEVWPGTAMPLGATWDGEGVNFALFSEAASAVGAASERDVSVAVRIAAETAARIPSPTNATTANFMT